MPELRVDQIGQHRPIGFVANVPSLQPSQFGVDGVGAGFCHLGLAQLDHIGQDRAQQQALVLGLVARFQVREVRSVATASGNSLACLRLANVAGGTG
ncbi:hypothetical protein XFLM_10025 [Xylella fastidiosa subsp. fastidiosa GB514]|uniref:Uncharacterized protein n=1 Tax=Xylella fastidiosa (strain M23) TaxID=405441 RepID=B2I4Q5_XYLF2|nr:hypothetical protein XfasM23_0915 [Xylella fastidiosa M23]ADN63884.1 hypothetical protein XFLM_10025 [Xylella fastidiosa subsp. fastidiosa GB514]EGO81831.1 hypothetical protein XFEB_01307 [Xylella fastidiosa EB92.1]KGM21061.1 hypothetical protein JT24_04800 [Xylella fastidiosa]KQH74480.1 hypothetical protein AOT81_02875 [Xylella fastidiosa]